MLSVSVYIDNDCFIAHSKDGNNTCVMVRAGAGGSSAKIWETDLCDMRKYSICDKPEGGWN